MVVKTGMVIKSWLSALAMAACLMAAPLTALGQAAQNQVVQSQEPQETEATQRLSDGWLDRLSSASAIAWSHAFALREDTAKTVGRQRRRLVAELETLITSARLGGNEMRAAGLTAWRQQLANDESLPARTPGRFDLPWLGAHLRKDPPLAKVALWGSCDPPAWVEIWHLAGVTRLPWQEGMTLDEVLERLSPAAYASADNAWLITPTGEQHRRGIAAWNAEPTPLSPGSRVMLELPGAEPSLSNPLSSRSLAAGGLVNERLPAYLATRLPGDDCTTWSKDT